MSTKIICATISIILCCNIFFSSVCAARHLLQANTDGLRVGFYESSCPRVEEIVSQVVADAAASQDPRVAAGLVRLQFHDCMVNGCDASILLDYTPSGEPTEKTSPGNDGLQGYDIIDAAKMVLEDECPNTVSCADIISFAARDAVIQFGLGHYPVPAGRRDGSVSSASNILANLPLPSDNVDQLMTVLSPKGIEISDIVVLLGAHSIGVAHCNLFETDIYNYSSTQTANPFLNTSYVDQLRSLCPPPGSPGLFDKVVPLNADMTENQLSNNFYTNLLQGKAVIGVDQNLLASATSRDLVSYYSSRPDEWSYSFRKAMIKLSYVDVLTGENGEIRQSCRAVNQ